MYIYICIYIYIVVGLLGGFTVCQPFLAYLMLILFYLTSDYMISIICHVIAHGDDSKINTILPLN